MKQKELEKVKEGDFINHRRYGLCYVDEVLLDGLNGFFGLAIRPLSIKGFNTLASESGTLFNRVLESSKIRIVEKIENPIIPKLIFKTEEGYELHEWEKLGKVSFEGDFSTVKIKEFESENEALAFLAS